MKKIKALVMTVLLLAIPILSMGGCGVVDNENTLNIRVWEGGYGVQWAKDLGKAFEAKNPGKKVNVEASMLRDKVSVELTAQPQDNKFDIIFSENPNLFKWATTKNSISGFDEAYVDLSDVYEYTPPGEDKPIKDKIYPGLYDYYKTGDNIYFMNWATTLFGILYNTEIIDGTKYSLPRTTDELIDLAKDMKAVDQHAFVYSGATNYWNPVIETWWAQYEGTAEFDGFWEGKKDGFYSTEIFAQPGRREAVLVLEQVLENGNGYCDPLSQGYPFMTAQTKFMSPNSPAAMMANGVWMENEMSKIYAVGSRPIDYMKTPVISALGIKLKLGGASATDAQHEAKLREAVDYADGIITEPPSGLSEAQLNAVVSARNMFYLEGIVDMAVVMSYSTKIDLAKDFLKFMYSNEGIEIYAASNNGGALPVEYDFANQMDGYSAMQKTRVEISSKGENLFFRKKNHPLVYNGGLRPFLAAGKSLEQALGAVNAVDKMSGLDIYNYDISYYGSNNAFLNLLIQSGVELS